MSRKKDEPEEESDLLDPELFENMTGSGKIVLTDEEEAELRALEEAEEFADHNMEEELF